MLFKSWGLTVKFFLIKLGSAIRHNKKTATLAIIKPKTMSLVVSWWNHDLLQIWEDKLLTDKKLYIQSKATSCLERDTQFSKTIITMKSIPHLHIHYKNNIYIPWKIHIGQIKWFNQMKHDLSKKTKGGCLNHLNLNLSNISTWCTNHLINSFDKKNTPPSH